MTMAASEASIVMGTPRIVTIVYWASGIPSYVGLGLPGVGIPSAARRGGALKQTICA